MTKPATLCRLALVCLLLASLQLLFYTGPLASDDLIYLRLARDAHVEGAAAGVGHLHARLAALIPLRACVWLAGPRTAALLPIPMFAAMGSTIAVWFFARRHLGETAAWMAAFALGLSPLCLLYATIWQPDSLAGLCLIVAMLLVGPALLDPACRRPVLRALLGGFVIGVGYSAKETAVLSGPGLALFVLLFRTRCRWAWWRLGLVAAGALLFLGLETTVLWSMTGDPLYRIHAVNQSQRDFGGPTVAVMLKYYLTEYPRWMLNPDGPYGWWGALYLVTGAAALWKAPDVVRLLVCVIAVTFGYLTVGTTDLTAYFPIHHQPRYLLVLMPLVAVLVAHLFTRLRRVGAAGRLVAAAVAVALVYNTIQFANVNAGKPYAAPTFAAGRKLFGVVKRPLPADARLCASMETAARLWPLLEQAGRRPMETITEPPTTVAGWLRGYQGTYVLVSIRDRQPYQQAMGVLNAASREALAAFPIATSAAPATTRLEKVGARLGLWEPAIDREARIDAYHITSQRQLATIP